MGELARHLLLGYAGGAAGVALASGLGEALGTAAWGGALGLSLGIASRQRAAVPRLTAAGALGMPLGMYAGWALGGLAGGSAARPFLATSTWGLVLGLALGLGGWRRGALPRFALAGACGMPLSLVLVLGLSAAAGLGPATFLSPGRGSLGVFAAWGALVGALLGLAAFAEGARALEPDPSPQAEGSARAGSRRREREERRQGEAKRRREMAERGGG